VVKVSCETSLTLLEDLMSERTNVKGVDFVKAWEENDSVANVAKVLGMKETSVQARASKMRCDGFPLKNMQRKGNRKQNPNLILAAIAAARNVSLESLQAEIAAKQNSVVDGVVTK
jgi:hypothetical protein